MTDLVLTRHTELAAHDGRPVTVEGTYVRHLGPRKMNDPTLHFFGFVDLQLEGGRVRLSDVRRDDAEVERFEGRRVRVRGVLVMDPEAGADYARPEPTPLLRDPGPLQLVGPPNR